MNTRDDIGQTAGATRILLNTDDFLMTVLTYLINSKCVIPDSFFTGHEVLQVIYEYSSRNSSTKFLAESFVEAIVNKMTFDEVKKLDVALSSRCVQNVEDAMIMIVLYTFPGLMSSPEYRSWCLRIKIDKNSESRIMRREIETKFENNNKIFK